MLLPKRYYLLLCNLEQFPIKCLKTKTKVITLANHKGCKAIHCPIKTQSNYMKCVRTSNDWFWFYFWLVEKVARVFLSQTLSVVMQNQSKPKLLSTHKWKLLYNEGRHCTHKNKINCSAVTYLIFHHGHIMYNFKVIVFVFNKVMKLDSEKIQMKRLHKRRKKVQW